MHDIVYALADKIPYAYLVTNGYLFLVVSIFFILAGEQSDLYKSLLRAKQEVEELNISLEKKVEERTSELKDLSLRDPLTGLRNRRYITEFVIEIVESFKQSKIMALKNNLDRRDSHIANKVIGVIILDIDHFKRVNDTYGHNTGDKVLVFLANKLKRIIRTDDIIIRWGGEEFFIVLNRTIPEYLPEFCRKVLTFFRETKIETDESFHISINCSLGCISYPICEDYPDSFSFEKSIILCDMAMYLAKESGRNRAVILEIDKELMNSEDVKSRLSIPQNKISIDDPIFKKQIII
jgi:diguanylate cyclase (GGDEF)-like protein